MIPGWEDPLEKGMATHPSILAWRIPWTEEPGGLQSMGLQRVGHDWVALLPFLKKSSTSFFILLSVCVHFHLHVTVRVSSDMTQ